MATYKYSYHEERGEFHGYVENSNGNTIWEVHYPDFYEDEASGELVEGSTIFDDGFMKYQNDIDGLEKYLKSLGILKANDEILDNEDFANGGMMARGGVITKKDREKIVNTLVNNRKNELSVLRLPINLIKNSLGNPTINVGVIPYQSWETKKELTFVISYGRYLSLEMLVYGSYKKDSGFIEANGKPNAIKVINKILDDIEKSLSNNKMARGKKLDEYETYHKTLASALDEAERFVNNRGYEFSEDRYFPDLTSGGVRYGQTINTRRDLIEIGGKQRKNVLLAQIYRMDSGTYELNMYFGRSNYASGGSLETKLKKKLSESFELPMEMAVYVPSTDKANVIISKKEYQNRVEEVERYLSDLFGGYSAVSVDGGYVSDEKGLIQEDVTRVATFGSTENFESKFTTLTKKVVDWCNKWGQESMGFEFEGDMFYIDKKASFKNGGGVDDKKVIELTPIYTTRDKKGFRFYSTEDGKQLYAEKNGDIYNVNEDTLKPTTIIPLQRTRFKFVGLINDNDVKDLNPLHYERETQKRIEKSFGMANGGETKIKKVRTLAEAKKDPRVENIYFEPDDYREISGSWWLELKEGYICRSMSCGTIHEDTLKEVLDLLNTDVVKGNEYSNGGETDSKTYEKVKVTIRDVDMGGDVVYKGDHWFRKDQIANKTNEQIGKHILSKYFMDYGNTYKYSIVKTGETKQK